MPVDPLLQRPTFAWPTLALFAGSIVLWGTATTLASLGAMPVWAAVMTNTLASFWLFTVFHDASHNAVSSHKRLNDWIGRIAVLSLTPLAVFRAFRFIHMQHHRFANEDRERDPDGWCGGGRVWTLPLRWATLDLYYYVFYLRRWSQRPRSERRETLLTVGFGLGLVVVLIGLGAAAEMLLLWILPARISIFLLGFAFDFLPHYPHGVAERDNPWRATSNRVGMEWLLTPLLLYQNYHLVHHLYPRIPFYRYIRVWRAREPEHLANNPYLVTPLGRPLDGNPQ